MFFVDEGYTPQFSLVVELLAARWFNSAEKIVFNVILFLVCFVVLQIMMKGTSWVSFCDGAQSHLLNENSSWTLWITILQENWQEDLWGVKGWSYEEYIWCRLKKKEEAFWWWRKAKWLDFLKTRGVCRIWILGVVIS
jgi:hypothetical protein